MSWTVDQNFINNYRNQLELKFQQMGSRLRGSIRTVTQNGEFEYFDRIDTATANAMTTRHGDTPLDNIDHTRRRNQIVGYNHAVLFDNQDRLKMLIDPTNGYAQSQAFALGRQMDNAIIAGLTGTAYSGKTGATSVSYDTGYQVAVNFVESGTAVNSNLTIGKLRQARYLLDKNEAASDGERITCALTASQVQSLLRTTEVTSSDYNSVKALVSGQVNTFLGMNFVRTELLTKSSNNRTVLVYPESAGVLGVAQDLKVRITERADKNYSIQVYSEATFGATRLWEEKAITILCDETA